MQRLVSLLYLNVFFATSPFFSFFLFLVFVVLSSMRFPLIFVCIFFVILQAFSSYARDLGLSELARENDVIYSFIRCLSVVPLLPAHRIVEGVLDIWNEVLASGWAETLQPLFEYLERQWFPLVNELSVYDQPERTNNCSECDNHAMGTAIATNRPRIWELVCKFFLSPF